ncbi:MAG TPA: ABC transporter substrate-binding protein [Burkholderiales bacterium]|nr:ABC transporter substrate-binding protein [Burkholderiales bacterium]
MLRCTLLALAFALASPVVLAQGAIKIAILGPMAFVQGENHWAGAEMARDEINKAGGIAVGGRKRQIELIRADTNEIQSVPDATNAMERAITRDKADFLIGGFRSEAVLAMQEVAADYKKIFLGAGAAHPQLGTRVEQSYDRYKYWFRVTPLHVGDLVKASFAVLGVAAEQFRKERKIETPKVAIIAEKAIWTEGIVKAAQANFPKMKLEVVGLWQPSAVATDATAEIAAIQRAGTDIVFTVLSGPVGIVVGRQMGEQNLSAIAVGINVEAQKDEFWQAAAGKANYVVTLDTVSEVEMTPKTVSFYKAFRDRFKKAPTYNSAGTYDALHLLKETIEKADSTDSDKLIPVLEKTVFTGVSGVIEFDKRHDLTFGPTRVTGIAIQWQDGKKVPFWPPNVKGMQPFKMPAR